MIEAEEVTRLVDGVYKGLLDKFNPGARQLVNAGKQYLKALHGAAAASKLYTEAITKLALQAQHGTWGATGDVGVALLQVGEVYREIQAQQINILKAFYVDLLVPLENNIEKDTKVVQTEQKKFLAEHKKCSESYNKAAASVRKDKKKHRNSKSTSTLDKELKHMQILEEERAKLDAFCEESLKNAFHQERRRYGFVLERQCSLAKHCLAYHNRGSTMLQKYLENWQDLAKGRDMLPDNIKQLLGRKNEDGIYVSASPDDDERASISSQLRKTKSMDASCLDLTTSNNENFGLGGSTLPRARSEFNLSGSSLSINRFTDNSSSSRPKSIAVPQEITSPPEVRQLVRALYSYLSSGANQLSFIEGDVITLIGERNKGWQYGENSRTQRCGWFPIAYTEVMAVPDSSPQPSSPRSQEQTTSGIESGPSSNSSNASNQLSTFHSGFGDCILARVTMHDKIRREAAPGCGEPPPPPPPLPAPGGNKKGNVSLHSSNDSGFHNDVNTIQPPPAPEIDYSDDDVTPRKSDTSEKSGKQLTTGWLLLNSARNTPIPSSKPPSPGSTSGEDPFPAPTMPAPQPDPPERDDTVLLTMEKAKKPKPVKRSKSLLHTISRIIGKDSVTKPSEENQDASTWNHLDMVSVDEKVNNWHCAPVVQGELDTSASDKDFEKFIASLNQRPDWDHASVIKVDVSKEEPTATPKAQAQTPAKTSSRSRSSSTNRKKETRVQRRHSSVSERSLAKPLSVCSRSYEDITQFFSHPLTTCQSRIDEKPQLKPPPQVNASCFHPDWIFWTRDGKQISTMFSRDNDFESIMLVTDQAKPMDSIKLRSMRMMRATGKELSHKNSILKKDSTQSLKVRKIKRPYPKNSEADLFNYGASMQRRLFSPERESVLDQKSMNGGHMCGKWYDLWQPDTDEFVKILC